VNKNKFMDNVEEKKEEDKNSNDDLKKLLELNLEKNEEILSISKDIKRYIKWQQIWSTLRFLLIFVPIVLGFIYLPPLLKDVFAQYRDLLK
jgi:hypothetical protein